MPRYEYKVVPAPTKGQKGKGVKGAEARFSHALQELMNALAGYGWEYQRAETLPSIERSGITSSTTEWRNVLVFRRLREHDAEAFAPELLPPPETIIGAIALPVDPAAEMLKETPQDAPVSSADEAEKPAPEDADTALEDHGDAWDNEVEDTEHADSIGSAAERLAAARKGKKTKA